MTRGCASALTKVELFAAELPASMDWAEVVMALSILGLLVPMLNSTGHRGALCEPLLPRRKAMKAMRSSSPHTGIPNLLSL